MEATRMRQCGHGNQTNHLCPPAIIHTALPASPSLPASLAPNTTYTTQLSLGSMIVCAPLLLQNEFQIFILYLFFFLLVPWIIISKNICIYSMHAELINLFFSGSTTPAPHHPSSWFWFMLPETILLRSIVCNLTTNWQEKVMRTREPEPEAEAEPASLPTCSSKLTSSNTLRLSIPSQVRLHFHFEKKKNISEKTGKCLGKLFNRI